MFYVGLVPASWRQSKEIRLSEYTVSQRNVSRSVSNSLSSPNMSYITFHNIKDSLFFSKHVLLSFLLPVYNTGNSTQLTNE